MADGQMIADTPAATAIWLSANPFFVFVFVYVFVFSLFPILSLSFVFVSVFVIFPIVSLCFGSTYCYYGECDDDNYTSSNLDDDDDDDDASSNIFDAHHPSHDPCVQKVVCWKRAKTKEKKLCLPWPILNSGRGLSCPEWSLRLKLWKSKPEFWWMWFRSGIYERNLTWPLVFEAEMLKKRME